LASGEEATTTEANIVSFEGGYGSMLFLEDPSPYDVLQSFKMYADKFHSWRDQTSGMHQLLFWTALKAEGLRAYLQHYNPLVDDEVKKGLEN
jgi:predicted oxidoreductase (fatty acid repression mutant protein)